MNLWETGTTSEDQPSTGLSFKLLLLVRMFESSFIRAYFRIKSLMKGDKCNNTFETERF